MFFCYVLGASIFKVMAYIIFIALLLIICKVGRLHRVGINIEKSFLG